MSHTRTRNKRTRNKRLEPTDAEREASLAASSPWAHAYMPQVGQHVYYLGEGKEKPAVVLHIEAWRKNGENIVVALGGRPGDRRRCCASMIRALRPGDERAPVLQPLPAGRIADPTSNSRSTQWRRQNAARSQQALAA